MPKKVFDGLYTSLSQNIRNNYSEGDRFPSVRAIARDYHVSLQTAHKVLRKLVETGYITVREKTGIIVARGRECGLENRSISVVSANTDERFNKGYLRGITNTAEAKGVGVAFYPIDGKDQQSVGLGDYLLSLNTDGIIALYMRDALLPLYHVMREGRDIVSDIIMDGIPALPAVQTDNYGHAYEAGKMLLEKGYQRFLMAGYRSKHGNRRFEGFLEALRCGGNRGENFQYACLSEQKSMYDIDRFFGQFNRASAVFSDDYSANYVLAAKFVQHGVKVKNDNFIVYEADENVFDYNGIFIAKSVGISLEQAGRALCNLLLTKWETGSYPLPLQIKC
jgi:DNA-binding LacI/PurR family transcriptional regulator